MKIEKRFMVSGKDDIVEEFRNRWKAEKCCEELNEEKPWNEYEVTETEVCVYGPWDEEVIYE